MGIGIKLAEFILREHMYHPLPERVYTIGRPFSGFDEEMMKRMFRSLNFAPHSYEIVEDDETHEAKIFFKAQGKRTVSMVTFFQALGVKEMKSIDISQYENAEILMNLNDPCPSEYVESCDFIVDGSALDNIFDAAQFLRNMTRLLRPGGRIVTHNVMTHGTRPYICLVPPWYYDFFVINRFADVKLYVTFNQAGFQHMFKPLLPEFSSRKGNIVVENFTGPPELTTSVIVLAEKSEETTWEFSPTQDSYRAGKEAHRYGVSLKKILSHPRPYQSYIIDEYKPEFPEKSDWPQHYEYIGHHPKT